MSDPTDPMVVTSNDGATSLRTSDWDELQLYVKKLYRIARAASNCEDMLEVPSGLGYSGQMTCEKAIRELRDALADLHPIPVDMGQEFDRA